MKLKNLCSGIITLLVISVNACNSRETGLDTKPSLIVRPISVRALAEDGQPKNAAKGFYSYNSIKNPIEFCIGGYGSGSETAEAMAKTARDGYFAFSFNGEKNPASIRIVKFSPTESCRDQGFDTSVDKTFDRTYIRLNDLKKLEFDADDVTGFFLRSGTMDNLKTYSRK